MSRHQANRGPLSRLPEDRSYWVALTDRLMTDATGRLSAYRSAGTRWWHGFVRFSTPLFVGAAAAVIAALLWLPDVATEPVRESSPPTLYGFAPDDPLAALFVTSEDAPTMATLIATPSSERAP